MHNFRCIEVYAFNAKVDSVDKTVLIAMHDTLYREQM